MMNLFAPNGIHHLFESCNYVCDWSSDLKNKTEINNNNDNT